VDRGHVPNGLHFSVWLVCRWRWCWRRWRGAAGRPVLKLRGDYLAIVTLGFGEIIRIFMNNLDHPVNITNGPRASTRSTRSTSSARLGKPLQLGGFDIASVTCTTTCSWCW
jgi:branched-chain amino acid transport system permease protein